MSVSYIRGSLSSKIKKLVIVISDGKCKRNHMNMMILYELYKNSQSANFSKNDLVDMIKQKAAMSLDMIEFLINISRIIQENCGCYLTDIFEKMTTVYSSRLKRELDNTGRKEAINWIGYKYQIFTRLWIRMINWVA